MASIDWIATLKTSPFVKGMGEIRSSVEKTNDYIEKAGMSAEQTLHRIKTAAAGILSAKVAKDFAQRMTQVRSEFQQLEVAFTTMLGSAEKADTLMAQLTKTAAVTPFDLQGVANGAKQLLAYGISADKVNDTLVHLGDIAAGLSLPLGDLVYLYGTTMTQGRMFTQDLRQFQNRGIPIADELAKVFGVAKEKVGELVTAGKVGAEEFNKAIMAMSSEGGKFAGLMEAQSKTIGGQISNIEDAVDNMFNELGKKSEGVINAALSGVSFLVENYETIGKVIVTVAASYGAYKAALLAVVAAQKMAAVWGNVQAFLSLAKSVTSAKDAMLLFNMVCKASPVGLILGAVTSAAVAFGLFSTSSNGATAAVEKYGKSAADTLQRVDTLTAELKGLTEGSTLHKKVMDELNQILEEYGVSQVKEGDNIDTVNAKREQTIELIKQEAIERQRLNSLEEGGNTYAEAVKNARQQLNEDLKGAGTWQIEGFTTTANNEVRQNADAISAIISQLVESNIDLIAQKEGEEYENGLTRIFEMIQERMRRIGISEATINEAWLENALFSGHDNIVLKYVESLREAKEEYIRFSTAVNAVAEADAQAVERPADKAREAADFSQTTTENLISKIAELKGACDAIDREIDIRIKWGASMAFNSDDVLDFTDLHNAQEELKKRMDAANSNEAVDTLLKEMREGMSKATYGSKARKIYEQSIRELSKRKSTNAVKTTTKKDTTAEKAAQRRQRQFETEQRQLERQATERRDFMDAITTARIAQITDDGERERAEQKAQFERTLRQIQEQANQYKKAAYQEAKERFEAANKNKGVVFSDTEEGRRGWQGQSLSADQQGIINARLQEARTERARQLEEERRRQQQALYDYIREYGSIQQQREAVTREYDEKIARTTDEIQRATLERQRQRLTSELDMKELQQGIDWEAVFGNLDQLSTDYLRTIRERLRLALDAKDITAENAKVLTEKIREIEDTIVERKDVWSALLPGLRERKRLTEQAAAAEKLYQQALDKESTAYSKVIDTKRQIQEQLNQIGIRDALGQKITVELEAISEENKDFLLSSLDKGSDLYNALLQLFQRLATDKAAAGKAGEETKRARTQTDVQWDKLKSMNSLTDVFSWAQGGNPLKIIQGVTQNAQSMAELIDKIGLENTDFGNAVHGFADGCNGFNSAVQALASGDVFGAVNGILDGIAGYGKMGISTFVGGGNEDEMEEEISRLSESNDNLAKAIDALSERIRDTTATNAQSLEAYREAMRAEREWEENQRKKIDARAAEYANSGYGFLGLGGKSSFNASMAGSNWEGWRVFSEILAKHLGESGIVHDSVSNDSVWNLTPEEMALLRQFAPKEWQSLMSGEGHSNPQELVNEYIERAGMMDSLTSAFNEKLTGYTWEGFLDSYKSLLKDLTSDTEDFAGKIEDIISNALLESLINEEFQSRIRKLYGDIAAYAEDGLSAEEIAHIRRENEEIANAMLTRRNQLVEAGLIKDADKELSDSLTLDDIRGNWTTLLMSMSEDTAKWGQDIAKIMTEALIQNNIFNEEWEELQEGWLERYNEAINNSEIGDAQRQALLKQLQEEQETWLEDNRRKAKQIYELTGYDPNGTQQQSATVQAMERITVDQADELIGRMNAGQMIWEQHKEVSRQMQQSLLAVQQTVGGTLGSDVSTLVSLAATRNQSLSAILETAKGFRNDMLMAMEDLQRVVQTKL